MMMSNTRRMMTW